MPQHFIWEKFVFSNCYFKRHTIFYTKIYPFLQRVHLYAGGIVRLVLFQRFVQALVKSVGQPIAVQAPHHHGHDHQRDNHEQEDEKLKLNYTQTWTIVGIIRGLGKNPWGGGFAYPLL